MSALYSITIITKTTTHTLELRDNSIQQRTYNIKRNTMAPWSLSYINNGVSLVVLEILN